MRLHALLIALYAVFSFAKVAHAGALFPCLKAASSSNGRFLVLANMEMGPSQAMEGKVKQVSFQVFPQEKFVNKEYRLDAPATYWADGPVWNVVVDGASLRPGFACPGLLITNDGKFLVLLGTEGFSGDDSVIRIYRKNDNYGSATRDASVVVKDIALKKIWPPEKLASVQVQTDESPLWFADGSFEFSSDCSQLIHKTRWGNTVSIKLENGDISWK